MSNENHKKIESFDEFVSIELKKLKKDHPATHIMHHVSMVSEEEPDVDETDDDSDISEESEIEHQPEDIVDESVE